MNNTTKEMSEKGYMLYRQWERQDKKLFDKFQKNDCLDVIRALAELISGNTENNQLITF